MVAFPHRGNAFGLKYGAEDYWKGLHELQTIFSIDNRQLVPPQGKFLIYCSKGGCVEFSFLFQEGKLWPAPGSDGEQGKVQLPW